MSTEWKQIFFLFSFFIKIKKSDFHVFRQHSKQTDLVSSLLRPLPPVEQGPGSPTTMPHTHRVTLGKSLNLLPGFSHLHAGRGILILFRSLSASLPALPGSALRQSLLCILAQASHPKTQESDHTKAVLNFFMRQLEMPVVKNINIRKPKPNLILFSMKTVWKNYLCAV